MIKKKMNKSMIAAIQAGFIADKSVLNHIGSAILQVQKDWLDESSYIKYYFNSIPDAIDGYILIALSELKESGVITTIDPLEFKKRPKGKLQKLTGRLPSWADSMRMKSVIPNDSSTHGWYELDENSNK